MNAEIQAKGSAAGLRRKRQIAFNRAKSAQAMFYEGQSVKVIARHFGVKVSTIRKDLNKDLTLPINNPEITG